MRHTNRHDVGFVNCGQTGFPCQAPRPEAPPASPEHTCSSWRSRTIECSRSPSSPPFLRTPSTTKDEERILPKTDLVAMNLGNTCLGKSSLGEDNGEKEEGPEAPTSPVWTRRGPRAEPPPPGTGTPPAPTDAGPRGWDPSLTRRKQQRPASPFRATSGCPASPFRPASGPRV